MTLETISEYPITSETQTGTQVYITCEKIARSPEANRVTAYSGKLVQQKDNPGTSRNGNIPANTSYFDARMQIMGGLTRYVIEAKNSEGNTLNTFYLLV